MDSGSCQMLVGMVMYVIVSMGWYGQCSYGMSELWKDVSELWNIDYIDDCLSLIIVTALL